MDKSSLKQQQQQRNRPSVEQHHKHNQSNKDKQWKKGANTPKIGNSVRSNMTCSGGERSSPIH